MLRPLAAFALCAAPALTQIPYGHLIIVHSQPSPTVPAIGIVDPDLGTATPLLPMTGSLSSHGSRSVAIDPAAPNTLYSITTLSTSVQVTVPVLQLTGNRWTRTNLPVTLGGVPHRLDWATGHGLLLLGRGGQINRMFLRNMATGTLTPQPTANLLPNNASDVVFLGGKAFATSEGNGTASAVGAIVEWDLAANTDRVLGGTYPPLHSLAVFSGQLIAGDAAGNVLLIDPVTGAASTLLTTGLGKLVALAVDAQLRIFALAENAGTWSIHNAFNPVPPLYVSTLPLEGLEIGPTAVPTMLTFGAGCPGSSSSAAPVLGFSAPPALGTTFGVDLARARPSSLAVFCAGSSRVQSANGPLPLDLGFLGMPGCTQYTDVLATVLAPTDALGGSQLSFALPANPAFAGLRIPMQWVVLDPGANALGATTSSGGEAYVQ